MTRTLIDVDDEALQAAMAVLGTDTKVATINAALRRVADAGRRAEALRSEAALADLYSGLDRDELWR